MTFLRENFVFCSFILKRHTFKTTIFWNRELHIKGVIEKQILSTFGILPGWLKLIHAKSREQQHEHLKRETILIKSYTNCCYVVDIVLHFLLFFFSFTDDDFFLGYSFVWYLWLQHFFLLSSHSYARIRHTTLTNI